MRNQLGNCLFIVLDSSGVVGSGLAEGNHKFLGNFDECLDINSKVNGVEGINDITGQYCALDIPIQTLIGNQTNTQFVSIL